MTSFEVAPPGVELNDNRGAWSHYSRRAPCHNIGISTVGIRTAAGTPSRKEFVIEATTHWNAVKAALAAGKWEPIADAYVAAWKAGVVLPVTEDVFFAYLTTWPIRNAVEEHAAARQTLAPHVEKAISLSLDDSTVQTIVAYAAQPAPLDGRWLRGRRNATAQARGGYVKAAVEAFCALNGREAARRETLRWWAACELEEEREGILAGLAQGEALTRNLIIQLGHDAEALTDDLVARERIPISAIRRLSRQAPFPLRMNPAIANRLSDLLTLVSVTLDARDARFPASKRRPVRSRLLQDAIRRLRHHRVPEFELLAQALEGAWPDVQKATVDDDATVFPLMRLLHLRMILEQPELSGALRAPDRLVAPEVMLYVLGRDAVTYVPEIRVANGADRRWRAIWAENTAEAMSALVLEDRVALNLVTLARIPEEKTPTPDFRALTVAGDPIVYECKGATDLTVHKRQKRRALVQLGKNAMTETSWGDASHAYACCFFAARQGTVPTSCFSVEDPPFTFHDYFGEGNDNDAIRRHFAAVLGSAGLRAAAGATLTGNAAAEVEHQLFYAGGATQEGETSNESAERTVRFAGTYRNLEHAAKELGHPNPRLFAGVRMFTGIHEPSFASLAKGTLPLWALGTSETDEQADFQRLPAVGATANGVYSVLSDGAILAFELR